MRNKTNTSLKKFAATCCLFVLFATCGKAQNPVLAFPPNYIHNFGPLNMLPNGSGADQYPHISNYYADNNQPSNGDSVGPQNMYADESGNPLFSLVNGFLYNAHGYLIDSLIDSLVTVYGFPAKPQVAVGWAENCIVPVPGSCTQFYIFTAGDYSDSYYSYANSGGKGCAAVGGGETVGYKPFYALIDMSLPTPHPAPGGEVGRNITDTLGLPGTRHLVDLYTSTTTTDVASPCNIYGDIHFACTKIITGSSPQYRLLFVSSGYDISVYKITSTAITYLSTFDYAGYGGTLSGYTYAEWAPNNLTGYNLGELEVYENYANSEIQVAVTSQLLAFQSI